MKWRFPLSAKILLWCVLNFLFLGAVAYLFFKIQFRFGLDSLLVGRAGDRIQAVSDVIQYELRTTEPGQWNEVLKRFSDAYQIAFFLFTGDGAQVAGGAVTLPAAVMTRLRERGAPPPRPRSDILGPQGNPGGGEARLGPRPPRGPDGGPDPPPQREPPRPGPHPRLLMRSKNPSRYWVLVRLPMPPPPDRPRPGGLTLIAMSESLRGGGLFFDFMPWVEVALGVIAVSVLFWFPLVRGITRSIKKLTRATEQIAEGQFDVRVDTGRSDELGALSRSINQMAGRLAGFVDGQKRFLGDIAHELCSPLARAQMALSILEARADAPQKACVEDVREEVQEMAGLVNELLSFSKASLKRQDLQLKPVHVGSILQKVIDREVPEAIRIENQLDPQLEVVAEPELLARALANILRNAVRYAGDAGPILISSSVDKTEATVRVADQGPGVPENTLAQIFDPFYRVENSRSRESGGAGLGLAIVKTCVEACRGRVSARNRAPSGLEIDLTFLRA